MRFRLALFHVAGFLDTLITYDAHFLRRREDLSSSVPSKIGLATLVRVTAALAVVWVKRFAAHFGEINLDAAIESIERVIEETRDGGRCFAIAAVQRSAPDL